MINREDMLELTRRMTPARTCFDRIAGAYVNHMGEIEDTFNIHFGKLSDREKEKNLKFSKEILHGKTNEQLKEYLFTESVRGKDSMWMLLQVMLECGLKNDAVMDIFYEQMADGYPVDHEVAIYVFHGVYDVPVKGTDKGSLWESEETYDFVIGMVSPLCGEYQPDTPVLGFLYPAFSDRSGDKNKIDIFQKYPEKSEEGWLYKFFREHVIPC